MCPVRQFNVQLYVEKVFIAQKTSEDRGGKVRKRVKGTELLVDFTGKGIGGGGGQGGKSEEGTNAVAKTHRQTGYNNRVAGEKKEREREEARNDTD